MSHKILIVDDESENLRALERLFRGSYNVLTAESGAEALALLEQHDVALLDRKSTRLNSSHITISYAVFCLKKKKGVRYRGASDARVSRRNRSDASLPPTLIDQRANATQTTPASTIEAPASRGKSRHSPIQRLPIKVEKRMESSRPATT